MKIAFFVTEFPCITETFILNQITGLLDRGHNVTIFALFRENQPVVHADVAKYHLSERTFYYGGSHQPGRGKNRLRFASALGPVITSFRKGPVPLLRALYAGILRKNARSLRSLPKLARFLNRDIQSYDIVHCHFGPNGNLGAWLKSFGAIEGKLVTAFHGYDISEYTKRKGNQIYSSLFEAGDWFLPVNERWKKRLIELGCPEQRTSIHRMGVDTTRFPFVPRRPRGDGKTHLLTVGRLVEKKGVQYGIQAAAKVLKKYPHVEYTIVGDGPLSSELKRLTEALNINDHVKLLGWKQQEEIVELMRKGDILLAPSVTSQDGDEEGIPVVLMEALSQGLPVVSTHHGGILELVQDGESGFLVPERDVDALAEKLEYLIERPETWPEMGRAGRDYIVRYHDINGLNDQLVDLYQCLLSGELP